MTNNLEALYQDAKSALTSKEYDSASELLQQILVVDHDYKDAAHLLAKAVKLKRRRWYNDPRLWGTLGALVVIGVLVWLAPRIQLPSPSVLTPDTFYRNVFKNQKHLDFFVEDFDSPPHAISNDPELSENI